MFASLKVRKNILKTTFKLTLTSKKFFQRISLDLLDQLSKELQLLFYR